MSVKNILLMGIAPQLIAALALQARQTVDCDFAIAANSGDTCATFAASWGLTETAFAAINPTVSCPGDLDASEDYCVIGSVTGGTTTTSTTTTAKTTSTTKATTTTTTTAKVTTTTSTTSTTPVTTTTSSSQYEPTQSGLAADCDSFHLVATGDTCSTIESQAGISAADFASWNPTIDSSKPNTDPCPYYQTKVSPLFVFPANMPPSQPAPTSGLITTSVSACLELPRQRPPPPPRRLPPLRPPARRRRCPAS